MLTSTTWGTALLRGLYLAVIAGLSAGLVVIQQGGDDRMAIITGVSAALVVLGGRSGGEGAFDTKRQADGKQSTADVQPGKGQPTA